MNSICCSSQACCGFLCGFCISKLKTNDIQHARLAYIIIYLVLGMAGLLLLILAPLITEKMQTFGLVVCEEGDSLCFTNTVVHRLSFTLGIFHLVMVLGSLVGGECSAILEEGCWMLKMLLLSSLFFLSFLIPNSVFVSLT